MTGLIKIAAMFTVGYCMISGSDSAKEHVDKAIALPKRIISVFELKTIDRTIKYELIGSNTYTLRLKEFLAKHMEWKTREPGEDYWGKPYRLSMRGSLYSENSSVQLEGGMRAKYVVVSAGQDMTYLTMDDLTSKSSTNADVQQLMKRIEQNAEKIKNIKTRVSDQDREKYKSLKKKVDSEAKKRKRQIKNVKSRKDANRLKRDIQRSVENDGR